MARGQSIGGVEIDIVADLDGFNRSQAQAKRTAERTADQIAISYTRGGERITRSFETSAARIRREQQAIANSFLNTQARIRASSNAMANDLRAAVAGIGIAAALRQTVAYGDQWTIAENKIAAAGVAHTELAGRMSAVVALAKETGTEFAAISTLYGRVTQSARNLGLTQEEVLRVTELTAKAFVAGGASSAEQAAGITQLTQALQSSVLQGDELRSIRENAPLLAQAIADEFGVTIGELKKLGEEGKLTSDRVARAILKADGVQQAFARTNRTVQQSINNLETAFIEYIGTSETLGGAMQNLAGFINFVTDNMELFADAAIVAASVLGGTLAAGAIIAMVRSLATMVTSVRAATTAFAALKVAAAFFTGPVGAVILAVGAALTSMALAANDSSVSVDDLNESLAKFQDLTKTSEDLTDQLKSAQNALNKAIAEQGVIAQNTARQQVQAIEEQIAANDRLLAQQALKIRNDLEVLRQQNNIRVGAEVLFNAPMTIGDKRSKLFGPDGLQNIIGGQGFGESRAEFLQRARDYLNGIRGRTMTALEAEFSQYITDIDQFDADVLRIENQLADIEARLATSPEQRAAQEQLRTDIGGIRGEKPLFGDGGSGGGARARGYQSDLEKLNATLRSIGEAASADAQIFNEAAMSLDVLLDLRDRWQKYGAFNPETGARVAPPGYTGNMDPGDPPPEQAITLDELAQISAATAEEDFARMDEITSSLNAQAAERSRIVLQALLDFADGAGVTAALGQLPSVSQLMIGDDITTFREKMRETVAAAADELAVGYDKLERDRDARVKEIQEAMAADLALAGVTNFDFDALSASERRNLPAEIKDTVGFYLGLVTDAITTFNDDVLALQQRLVPKLDFGDGSDIRSLGDTGDSAMAAMMALNTKYLVDAGIIPSEAMIAFQDQMTQSIRRAMYDGIVTGDWGDAFLNVVADALSTALAESLTGVGAWLGDFLFGANGVLSSMFTLAVGGIGSLFGVPAVTPMANGGNFQAGKPLLVGEAGRELLLPNFSGTVVPNSALTGSQGAYASQDPTVIGGIRMGDIYIAGDVGTADTLRQLRAEQEAQARRLPKLVASTMREVKRRT